MLNKKMEKSVENFTNSFFNFLLQNNIEYPYYNKVYQIINLLGGRVEETQKETHSYKIEKGFIIKLYTKEKFKPFSLLVELGNILLNGGYLINNVNWNKIPLNKPVIGNLQKEILNEFAAELLMPKNSILTELKKYNMGDILNIENISNKFLVPEELMTIRLYRLGYIFY